jgi:hypothetical protein
MSKPTLHVPSSVDLNANATDMLLFLKLWVKKNNQSQIEIYDEDDNISSIIAKGAHYEVLKERYEIINPK